LPYIQEADVVMSTDNALMVAVNFVKENKEEIVTFIILSVATIALAYFASAALAGSIMFVLRLAVFAPALGASADLWAADERFEQRSNCYAYKYLVNKPKGISSFDVIRKLKKILKTRGIYYDDYCKRYF